MAHKLKAINALRPRLQRGKPARINAMAKFIEGRTSITRGTVRNVLDELQMTILHFNRMGRSVSMPGIGTFAPHIGLDGTITTSIFLNSELREGLGTSKGYEGHIVNSDNIGITVDEIVTLWNEQNPTDPVDPDPVPTP